MPAMISFVDALPSDYRESWDSAERDPTNYHQYLGLFDALGQLNAWGHWPDYWPPTWHSTNPVLPPAMAVGKMTSESVRD
jgi:hypothetical protein